jgi:arylsulfatase A-like enzyme
LPPPPGGLFGAVDVGVRAEETSIAYQADHALRMLREAAGGGGPFFLRWDPPEPHLPNHVPEEDAGLYPPAKIPPWPSFPDPLVGKPPAQRRTRQRWGTDEWGWEKWQPTVSRYLATIDLLDRQIGRLLAELDRLGLTDNTLVVYTTDHGDMCGGHGMMDKHYCMYDDILRLPLLVRFPGRVASSSTCDALVSHEIDLARTLLSAAGIPVPPSFVGQDLLALSAGALEPRSDVLVQYFGTQQGLYSSRALCTHDWKYVYNPAAFDELYRLPTDPGELTNRVEDPTCAEILLDLRQRLGRQMTAIRDPLNPPLWTWPG